MGGGIHLALVGHFHKWRAVRRKPDPDSDAAVKILFPRTPRRRHEGRRALARSLALMVISTAALAQAPSPAHQVLDGIAATVNGEIILQSELQDSLSYQCLLNKRELATLTEADADAALQQLIDQKLIWEQMAELHEGQAAAAEIEEQVLRIRAQLGWQEEPAWQAALRKYNLSEDEVNRQAAMQFEILRFLDERFRTTVPVNPVMVEAYYNDTFRSQLKAAGGPVPPLSQVSGQIEKILIEKGINDLLDAWLKTLRSQASIHLGRPVAPGPGPLAAQNQTP